MKSETKPGGTPSEAARLTDLEAALAHLERNYDALNSVVVAQAKTLARLQKRLDQLDETVNNQELDRPQAATTKPPHY